MTDEKPACSLSGAEFGARAAEWARVTSRAIDRRVEDGRIVSTYPRDPSLLEQIRKLIAAEAECCPFMQFGVEEGADHVTVELNVPDGMAEQIVAALGSTDSPSGVNA